LAYFILFGILYNWNFNKLKYYYSKKEMALMNLLITYGLFCSANKALKYFISNKKGELMNNNADNIKSKFRQKEHALNPEH
jgi:hypothetical protein